MAAERTLVTRWKSVVDPSVSRAADQVVDKADDAKAKQTGIWAGAGAAIGTKVAEGLSWAAGKITDFVADSARAASDLKESVNVTQLTFGKHAKSLDTFFKGAAGSIGMSETAAREAASDVGGLLQNMGLGGKETSDWSKKLLTLSADMGSAFNSEPVDAIEAIGAGLRGESEPLRRYNVLLSAEAIAAKAAEMGLVKKKGKLDNTAKAQAALALITEQTSRVQGDFAATSDGAANAARIQAAKVEDLKAKFADSLLPAQEAVLNFTNDQLLPGLMDLTAGVKDGIKWVQDNAGALKAWGTAIAVVAVSYGVLSAAQGVASAGGFAKYIKGIITSTKAWAVVQGVLNVVMNANPISLVVIAIAALVAGVIVAYQNCEEFRKVCDVAFKAIAAAGRWLWNNALQPVTQWIIKGFAMVTRGIATALDALSTIPGFEWAKTAAAGMRDLADKADAAAESIGKIPDPDVDTGTSRKQVRDLDTEIKGLRGKIVEAKAKGDHTEVDRLKKKISELKGKKVTLEAKLKKGEVGKIAVKQFPAGNGWKFSALARGGILNGAGRHVRRFANGGVEDHRAQIARGGAMRLWAEPETGGEAYIPLAASKRGRSREIWWETGRRLGVLPKADGGVAGGGSAAGVSDEVVDLLRALLARIVTADDIERLIEAMRQVDAAPRPVAARRLGA